MAFIVGLSMYFAGAVALGLGWNLWRRRPFWRALHFAVIFGLFVVIIVAILAVAFDILDITPEPDHG